MSSSRWGRRRSASGRGAWDSNSPVRGATLSRLIDAQRLGLAVALQADFPVIGIGKSRLIYELFQRIESDPELIWWRQGRSLPYGDGVSLWAQIRRMS